MNPVTAGLLRAMKVLAKEISGYGFVADVIEAGFGKNASDSRVKELLELTADDVRRQVSWLGAGCLQIDPPVFVKQEGVLTVIAPLGDGMRNALRPTRAARGMGMQTSIADSASQFGARLQQFLHMLKEHRNLAVVLGDVARHSTLVASVRRSRVNVRLIATFTSAARPLRRTDESMATPCSVKA